jgi:hypothetical protein
MSAHTKGPWSVYVKLGAIQVDIGASPSGERPCIVPWNGFDSNDLSLKKNIANAHLIAAAPDLLKACQEFVRKCDAGEARSKRSYQQMKAAIDKALAHGSDR